MIDTVMVNIGASIMIVGGAALAAVVLGLVIYFAGVAWISASNKWRDILRAESLIFEYRRERKEYLWWKEHVKGNVYADDHD